MIEPRISWCPPFVDSLGADAVEFARSYGIALDDWQQLPLDAGMGVRADGRFASFEAGVNCARQNGKNEIALVRELYGLFVLGERLVIHSAHEFKTATEHQRRVEEVVLDSPDLLKRVKGGARGFKHAHGQEGFELKSGSRIRFLTRTKGGGRGHTGDLVVLDEAMILPAAMMAALTPTMAARSMIGNPQMWYFFTAVDRTLQEHGVHAARLRERATLGEDPSLAYFEWSVDASSPDEVTAEMAVDRHLWAQANPALGIRISEEHVANEQRSMDARSFAVERLGAGDYPRTDGELSAIDSEKWASCEDYHSSALDPVAFAFDVTPSRSSASIAAAGGRPDGLTHLEVTDQRRGTAWLVDRLLELQAKHRPSGIFCAAGSPAESLVPALEREDVEVVVLSAKEHALACGMLFDGVEQQTVRHRRDAALAAAVAGAVTRPLGEAWAWSRRNSALDISPLCAVTFALYGHLTSEGAALEPMVAFG